MFSQARYLAPDSWLPTDIEAFESGNAFHTAGTIIPRFEAEYCSAKAIAGVVNHEFCFNGECHRLGEKIDWLTNPSRDIEWHILLHKFYFAPGLAKQFARTGDPRYLNCLEDLVQGWISQTPPGFIATDVTARRVQNWIYACHILTEHGAGHSRENFKATFLSSLAGQVEFICNNMATARNHRTLELYAVFLASIAFPALDTGKHWRTLAVDEMLANIRTDILTDGVHCELSTDYHHIVLRSYLLFCRLARLNNIHLPGDIQARICRALDFSMHVHRPDGLIPALSDSDSRSFRELLSWGAELFDRTDYLFVATAGAQGKPPARPHAVFEQGGYVVLRSPWADRDRFADARYLVFDCGLVGAGNHGHLDALSVEVAAYGKPLIVDPGRYTYDEEGDINWRARFRQTSAHNTITVDGCEQAIYRQRGPKRRIFDPQPICALASHDLDEDMPYVHGFVQSPNYEAVHHRHIWFPNNRYWIIVDQIRAAQTHTYEMRYQLTPRALGNLEWQSHEMATQIISPGLTLLIVQDSPAVLEETSYVSSRYGSKREAPRICARTSAADHVFITLLYPTNASVPKLHLRNKQQVLEISVKDHERHDTWLWDRENQLIAFRDQSGMQAWGLSTVNCHG